MQLSGFFALLVGTFILSSSGLTSAKSNVMDKYTDESTIVRRLRGEDSVEEEKGFTSIYESAKRWFTKPLVEATVKTNKEGKEVLVIPPKQAAILAKNGIDSKELAANPTMEHLASVLNTYRKPVSSDAPDTRAPQHFGRSELRSLLFRVVLTTLQWESAPGAVFSIPWMPYV
ncbi:unnamed protein product [Peronospora belbahrii]|uniref:RxLR effector protein n=1 Tax=Peronospora belbahrii TaxID=622444 RepID=A0ABN8CSA4_9STRA|nr:unnamed protein product [Peronospora belbahrii]